MFTSLCGTLYFVPLAGPSEVAIDGQDGTGIEKGMAVEIGSHSGKWVYLATQPVAKGTDIFIELLGIDYTGKKVTMTENPVVGQEE